MIVGILMVRDEADVIGYTLAHLLAEGVDHILVSDNGSRDDTRRILDLYAEGGKVTVLDDPDPAYEQAAKMTRLAHMAHGMGATWVVPCDADEVIYSPDGRTLAEFLADCTADVVEITGFDHIATGADDPVVPNPFLRIQHRRAEPQRLPKVLFRATPSSALEMGNHGVTGVGTNRVRALELRHFQYRSLEQAARKLRQGKEAYDATDPMSFVGLNYRRGYFGTHWSEGAAMDDTELASWWVDLTNEPDLIHDPAPVRS